MKINPIINRNFIQINPLKNKQQNSEPNTTTTNPLSASDSYGKSLVSFRSDKAELVKKINQIPLQEKFWSLVNKLELGEGLVLAKDLKNFKDKFIEFNKKAPLYFTKLTFLVEPKLEQNLFLMNNPSGLILHNLNDEPMLINGFESVFPYTSREMEMDDKIRMIGHWTSIFSEPHCEGILKDNAELFSKTYDFRKKLKDGIASLNKSFIEEVVNPPRKTTNDKLTFAQVGGQDEAIEALVENFLLPIKNPKAFPGLMLCRGAILYGPPGTGKSLLAQALISEAGFSAFEMAGTEFSAKYVGESEKNCRELFERAVEAQPSIVFIDEIDALGKARGGSDEHGDKLLNQFLSCMSNIEKNKDKVFFIGATNRLEDLDKALTRGGRFDLMVECKAPDIKGTIDILNIHVVEKFIDKSFDKEKIAKKMVSKSMTGADIALIVRRAHINALRRTGIYQSMLENRFSEEMMNYFTITEADFEKAIAEFNSNIKKRNPIGY